MQKRLQRESTTLLRSTICFWVLTFSLLWACPPSGPFGRPFVVHQLDTSYGLTVSPANSNLVPSRLGLLPERVFVSVFFFSPSWCLVLLIISRYEVPGIFWLLTYCSRALFLVQYHFVVERYVVDVVYAI